jgi:hypothetical protein
MEGLYGWDGGYWEQRAISERRRHNWPLAETYAAKAAGLIRDDHRLTTLGTILLHRARADRALELEDARAVVDRAHNVLLEANGLRPQSPVAPLAALRGLAGFGRTWAELLPEPARADLLIQWNSWLGRARRAERASSGRISADLEREIARWSLVSRRLVDDARSGNGDAEDDGEWEDDSYT